MQTAVTRERTHTLTDNVSLLVSPDLAHNPDHVPGSQYSEAIDRFKGYTLIAD